MAAGPGTGAGGEDEGVGAVVGGGGGHLEGLGEVVLRLAREADDDVGGHGQVVDAGPGRGQAVEITLGRVTPAHGGQDRSLPDWRGRWRCSQTTAVSAMAAIVS